MDTKWVSLTVLQMKSFSQLWVSWAVENEKLNNHLCSVSSTASLQVGEGSGCFNSTLTYFIFQFSTRSKLFHFDQLFSLYFVGPTLYYLVATNFPMNFYDENVSTFWFFSQLKADEIWTTLLRLKWSRRKKLDNSERYIEKFLWENIDRWKASLSSCEWKSEK